MFRSAITFVFLALGAALIGCGGSSGGSSGGAGAGNGSGGSSATGSMQSYTCCLNGTYYNCSSEAASNACFSNSDTSGCSETHTDPSGQCN